MPFHVQQAVPFFGVTNIELYFESVTDAPEETELDE